MAHFKRRQADFDQIESLNRVKNKSANKISTVLKEALYGFRKATGGDYVVAGNVGYAFA